MYQKEYYENVKEVWKEARRDYLDQAHTKEEEVITDRWKNQYFYLDGHLIYMPNHLLSPTHFIRHLK